MTTPAGRARTWARGPLGFSAIDLVFTCAAVCVLCAVAIPQTLSTIDRSRSLGAARYLASRIALARAMAVNRSATIGLQFVDGPRGVSFRVIEDGNFNGIRTRDIELEIDRAIEPWLTLTDLFPGVEIGLTPQMPGADAVQLGRSHILSFTAHGTASSGSVYVRGRDGTQWVVRVLGATARARVLRFEASTGEWVNAS